MDLRNSEIPKNLKSARCNLYEIRIALYELRRGLQHWWLSKCIWQFDAAKYQATVSFLKFSEVLYSLLTLNQSGVVALSSSGSRFPNSVWCELDLLIDGGNDFLDLPRRRLHVRSGRNPPRRRIANSRACLMGMCWARRRTWPKNVCWCWAMRALALGRPVRRFFLSNLQAPS